MKNLENNGLPAQGDFYNEGDCLVCGAPHAEAPTLMAYAPDGRCYFKQQPQNEDELDQAIGALWVSCISAIRYRGTDEAVLKRLYENGLADSCDYRPQQEYALLIRDRVRFDFEGSINELADLVVSKVKFAATSEYSPGDKIAEFHSDEKYSFSFVHVWYDAANAVSYRVACQQGTLYELQMSVASEFEQSIIGTSARLHDIIKFDKRFMNIRWLEKDQSDGRIYLKPY